MGSHIPDGEELLPFGFAAPDFNGLPFDGSPGETILSASESRFLNDFMHSIVTGNNEWCVPDVGEGLNFADHMNHWYSGPEVVAHGTSYGTPISHPPMMNNGTSTAFQYISPSSVTAQPHPGELNPSADVLAAATALSRPNRPHTNAPSYGAVPALSAPTPMGPPAGNPAQFAFPGFEVDESNGVSRNPQETFMADMVFGDPTHSPVPRQPVPQAQVQYGSDPTFNQPCFQPRSWNESLDGLSSHQSAIMECFQRTDSAAPTRVSSPVLQNASLHTQAAPRSQNTNSPAQQADSAANGPAKKRKMSQCANRPTGKERAGGGTTVKRRQSSTEAQEPAQEESAGSATNDGAARKRRKSAPNSASKPPRENLSDAQKRENHIKSEQKRRGQIKEGFSELKRLVPELMTGSGAANTMSKANVLELTGNWVEHLKKGNERLRAELDRLCQARA